MKKCSLFFITVLLLALTSCSQVFEAGVSGRLTTDSRGSEQGAAGVYVYAYTNKNTYESDLVKFKNGSITRPSEGSYIPATTTNANGEFTINKIVWETKNGKFGKTADVINLYLIFYHEDYTPCGFGPVSVISGSTNSSSVSQKIEQVRFAMPSFNGQISDGSNNSQTEEETDPTYDNVKLLLTDKDFKVYEGSGSSVYTYSEEHGVDSLKYSHGHFTGLGAGLKWEGDSVEVNIVWDADSDGEVDTGEYYYPVTVTKSTTSIPSKIVFTKTK